MGAVGLGAGPVTIAAGLGRADGVPVPVPVVPVAPVAPVAPTTVPAPAPAPVQVADPVRIRIPAIGVDAPVGPLDVLPDGRLAAPAAFGAAGWWRDGPEPGEPGPAVVAGHVDSVDGPAVFYRLRDLRPGDRVVLDRADGTSVEFAVRGLESGPKDAFPTAAVYGPTAGPALRLVTCAGAFDRVRRHYTDNLVVFADPV
ncbi:hypothetical protein BJF78_36500 [Pseudonocardia sp. CNS-139]|nr:hypothetical protein BJF78_36500 [Pseudonocardia sp. CNS-139]